MKFGIAILLLGMPRILGVTCDTRHNASKCLENGVFDGVCCSMPREASCADGYMWSRGEEGCGQGFRNGTYGSCCTPQGMYCREPFVDPPTCKTSYSATNWWFDVYATVMEAWWLILGWDIWRSALKLTRHGLPRTVDAVQLLMAALFCALQCLYFLNPEALRLGGWFAVVHLCVYCLHGFPAGISVITILASVRSTARLQEGRQGFSTWELRAYFAGSAFIAATAIPPMVVRVVGELSEVPAVLLRHVWAICLWIFAVASSAPLVLVLLFSRTFRHDPRATALLKTARVGSRVCLIALSLYAFRAYQLFSDASKGLVGEMVISVESCNALFPSTQVPLVATAAFLTWALPRIRDQLGLQWEQADGDDLEEAVLSGALVLFFALGLYVPTVMPIGSITVFLKVLTLVICFSATLFIDKFSRASREYLFDLSVAAYLRKRDTVLDMIKFSLLGGKDTVVDFLMFATMPFSKATPWPFGLQSLDWMGNLDGATLTDQKRGLFLTTLIVIYLAWLCVSLCLRAFPPSYRLDQAHLVISWFLYLPCGLAATRLLLGGTQCRNDATLAWDGTPCDGSSAHRMVLIFGISGALWFVLLPSLHFQGIGKFKIRPLVVENPSVSVRNHFLRALGTVSAIYLTNTPRIIADLVIVFLLTAQQFYDPLAIGRAYLNSIRAGAFLAALSCHLVAPLNFVMSDSFTPFTIYLFCIPAMFLIGFKGSFKRFVIIADKIKVKAGTAHNVDFAKSNLPPRLLGACLHAPPLNQFLRAHLNILTGRAKNHVAIARESQFVQNDALISVALAHLTAAISTRCGRRALQQSPEYVTAIPQWLDSPHRSAAVSCVLAMADIEALHTRMRTHVLPALLAAWQLLYDAPHTSCAESIMKIRGVDKIIVSFGPIRGIRRIAISHRTVWIVPYAPTLVKEDPIDAVLTFPPRWDLPLGDIMPSNVPHLCIPTVRNRKSGVPLTGNRLVGHVRSMARTLKQFSALSLSVASRVSSLPRLTASGDFHRRPTTAVLPMVRHNLTGVPPTSTQSRWMAPSPVQENKEDTPSATSKDGSATSLAMAGGTESAYSVVQQDWEGNAWVTGGGGEKGSRSAVAQGKGRETLLVEEEPARQGVEGEAWVAWDGEDGASSRARGGVSAFSALRQSVAGRLLPLQRRQKLSMVTQKAQRWCTSLIRHHEEIATRSAHILFSLLDGDLVTDEEDGVPTHRLRQALTAFYAFNLLPRDYDDEDDSVDRGDEAEKNRKEKEDA
eukprot:GEMP01003266.1.p1 GENE.GEMP01003266.1~~GEMP01003266.1.p1  ORF type:complete len:1246 (+),score=236.74 GEMP01003266.1:158-3895(+)